MYLSLRVKILSVLFIVIASLSYVFNESAVELIVAKTAEMFRSRVEMLLQSLTSYWEDEKISLLRSATLLAESDKLVNYSVYGLANLLKKEMKRALDNSEDYAVKIHLNNGLLLSVQKHNTLNKDDATNKAVKSISPLFAHLIDITNPRAALSRLDIYIVNASAVLSATVPMFKNEEFVGFLTLERELGDALMQRIARNLVADTTLAWGEKLLASSFGGKAQADLAASIADAPKYRERIFTLNLDNVLYAIGCIRLVDNLAGKPLVIYCATSQEQMAAMVSDAREQTFNITLIALAIALIISFLFSETVLLTRIRQMRDGARKLAQGDLSYRLPERGRDELGDLAASFNEMADALFRNSLNLQQTINRLESLKGYIQDILSSISTAVITFDKDAVVESANNAAKQAFQEICPIEPGMRLERFINAMRRESKRKFIRAFRNFLKKGQESIPFDVQFDFGEGRGIKIMETRFNYLRDNEHKPYGMVMTLDDITQRRIIEQQLYHADKLSSIGQLAASVAHEIKNPLASIKTLGQLLQEETEIADTRREYIDVIVSEVDRLNGVVEQLLAYSKPEKSSIRKVAFSELIEPVLALVDHEASRHNVILKTLYSQDMCLTVDAEKFKQVLLNLIVNAIQAMPQGGDVTIEARTEPTTPWSVITVKDTGCGISPDIVSHVFEPFFSTKQRGTGLGLAIVKKIVDLHGGRIELQSTLSVGSVFTIYLPKERKEIAG